MIGRVIDSLRALLGRARFEREMDEELRAHLDFQIDALIAAGLPRAEAVRRARASFGSVGGTKDEARAARGIQWLDELRGDVRYTIRALRSSPGYTAVAVLTLALGIGANTTIFSVVNGILLRPLPFPESSRLVHITQEYPWGALWTYRKETASYQSVAGYGYGSEFNLYTDERPERIRGRAVSADFFDVLGIAPALGRTLRAGEDAPGAPPVAVLSHGLWQRRFGANPAIVGTTVQVNGTVREVVGVMPAGFTYPVVGTEMWVPVSLDPKTVGEIWGAGGTTLIGRLKPTVTVVTADAEHRALITRIRDAFPWRMPDRYGQGTDNHVRRLDVVTGEAVAERLGLLFAAAGLVLLVACANLANLNLTRLVGRERELAVRQAIGGTRFRVARQLVVEQLVVAAIGSALGIAGAFVGVPLLLRWLPSGTPRLDEVAVDLGVLGFTAVAALLAATLASIGPLLRLPRAGRVDVFAVNAKSSASRPGHGRASGVLVATEVALAVVLVVSAGLLIRSLGRLLSVDPGFRTEQLVVAAISPNPTSCKDDPGPCTCEASGRCAAFFPAVLDQLAAVPGVSAVALTSMLPLEPGQVQFPMNVEDHPVLPGQPAHLIGSHVVSVGYFEVMGVPILEGRPFTPDDRLSSEPVVVVSRSMAQHYWPGVSALGKHIKPVWIPTMATVVGVVADVRYDGLAQTGPSHDFYMSMTQWGQGAMTAVLRTSLPAGTLEPSIRQAVAAVDRTAPVSQVRGIDAVVDASSAPSRTTTTLIGLFAGLALLLGAIGVYGVLSYGVSQRRREIGIRMAIGAAPSGVRSMVMGEAARLVAAGVAVGLAIAYAGAALLQGFVFGVGIHDPIAFAAAPAVFLVVGGLAAYLPARRATLVSPTEVMRED